MLTIIGFSNDTCGLILGGNKLVLNRHLPQTERCLAYISTSNVRVSNPIHCRLGLARPAESAIDLNLQYNCFRNFSSRLLH